MLVLAEDAAEAVTSVDVQVGESVRVGDRFGERREWPGIRDALVRSVGGEASSLRLRAPSTLCITVTIRLWARPIRPHS